MSNRRPIRFSLTILASACAAITIAACGGGSDAPPYSPAQPTAFVPLAEKLPAGASEYDKHMQIARIAWAGNDDITQPHWCANPGTGGNPQLQDRSVIAITELFDGFYFTGSVSVGQFVMKTADGGYMLFDTMNNSSDVQNITIPQLQSAGIDPVALRALIVTHGHGDHDGGAAELQSRFNPAITVVGSADYSATKTYQATLKIDSTNPTPQTLTIGGKTLIAVATPGHTPGTTSYIVPVTYKGQQHRLAYWGGSAFPGTAAAARQYMQGAEAMYTLIKAQKVDGSINSHTFEDKSLNRIRAIQAQGGTANGNPMIQGTSKIQLGFAVLRSCSAAQLFNRDATVRNSVWRPTKVEFYDAGRGGSGLVVAARVSNYFNVLADAKVKFTAADGATCTATTNREGVASCAMGASTGLVTAEFDGRSEADGIDLASSATRTVN